MVTVFGVMLEAAISVYFFGNLCFSLYAVKRVSAIRCNYVMGDCKVYLSCRKFSSYCFTK